MDFPAIRGSQGGQAGRQGLNVESSPALADTVQRPACDDSALLASRIPNRIALAGGWIDQPFLSRHNPTPPGSMAVVSLQPGNWFMDRCGMAGSTRRVATSIWDGALPDRPLPSLVRELYHAENHGKPEPSGSQDMIGLIYPGVSRLDYDAKVEDGYFPAHIESCCRVDVAAWLEKVLHLIPVNQRPAGYNPIGYRNLDPRWIAGLGRSGADCYGAIVDKDVHRLGSAMNHCMMCWEAILPHTVVHPSINIDLKAILGWAQANYPGAMYSGCGGGYLIVASTTPVAGAMSLKVRIG